MAPPAVEHRGSDPSPYGPAWPHASRHGAYPSRVSEVLSGKKGLSMTMVQRLRARFRVPADLLIPPPKNLPARRAPKRAAASINDRQFVMGVEFVGKC
jgi:hypothetical protein